VDRRRFLLTSLAGAFAAPLAAVAQPARVARIGYLSPLSAAADAVHMEAFRQGLRDLGYVEGQNAVVEVRYADDKSARLPALATELVRLEPEVIVAAPTTAVRAAQQATRTIPIVMAFAGDPVGERFVAGLARPGGNITGHSVTVVEITTKRVEFLEALVPRLAHVMHLVTPGTTSRTIAETESAGRGLGIQVTTTSVADSRGLDQAFSAIHRTQVGGLVVSLTLQPGWKDIVDFALKRRLPTVSGPRQFVEAGGLMAYGPHYPDLFRRSATYVDKILKGARPADLPVEQPTRFELVINMKTAKALGRTIPPSMLARADEIIE
jgi:putative ABC transport system substrate-binding protein